MSRWMSMVIFITIASAIYFGMHYFVYKSLTRSWLQSPGQLRFLKWLFWLSGFSFIISRLLSGYLGFEMLNHYAFTWMGIMSIAFTFFIVQRILVLFFSKQAKTLTIVTVVLIGAISLYSLINGLQAPRVKKMIVPIKNLPQTLSGFSIVHLSDLHLEPFKSKGVIFDIIEKVNALNADLIVITGDLIDGGAAQEPLFCEKLKELQAKHGVIAVTGNHEYYTGLKLFSKLGECSNFRILRNQSETLPNGLQIIGLEDDEGLRSSASSGPDLDKAMAGLDPQKPTIMLYHRPMLFDEAVAKGVDLALAGHTHAGQIPPMDLIVWFYYKYPYGLYKKDDSYIYTTAGVGYWGPAMRFLSSSEIAFIELVPKE